MSAVLEVLAAMSTEIPSILSSDRAGAAGLAGRYENRPVAFLNQHGKEIVVGPVLAGGLGCQVERVRGFDTDQLGTFTRERPRSGTQLEAARVKAREGMRQSGLRLGLASEGSFGLDPMIGFFPWNLELLVWIDDDLELEVVGVGSSRNTNFTHLSSASWEEVTKFAEQIGFPEHHLIVRPFDEDDPRVRKGLADWDTLRTAFESAREQSENGRVFVETDMRAHANPKRMSVIAEAAEDLVKKLRSVCPQCHLPGFARVKPVPGRRCEACGCATDAPVAWVHGCLKCPYQETYPLEDVPKYVSPAECPNCNP